MLFWAYFLGYICLTLLFVAVLWCDSGLQPDLTSWSSASRSPAWRLVAILALCNLAGLPPFFFFLCKLSLLSAIAASGAWAVFLFSTLILVLGWYAYQVGISRLLLTQSNSYPRYATSRTTTAAILATCGVFFLTGALFFDDLLLLSAWLSV